MLRSNRKSVRTTIKDESKGLPVFQNGMSTMHIKDVRRRPRGSCFSRHKRRWTVAIGTLMVVATLYLVTKHHHHNGKSTNMFSQHRSSMAITTRAPGVVYDVVVAGAGPAGLTAALFAARAGLQVLVLGSSTGQLSEATALDNFPSFTNSDGHTKGEDWLVATKQQVASVSGVHFGQGGLLVSRIERTSTKDGLFVLALDENNKYSAMARSVIIATGATGRRLGLPHEDTLWGKAVHSCAICDGSSYAQKTVVVVGGGDAALDAAILLSRHAKNVVLLHRRTEFRASNQHNLQLANQLSNVQLRTPYIVTQYDTIVRDEQQVLMGVTVQHVTTGTTEEIACDGVFVMIGATPNTGFVKGALNLDAEGLIILEKQDGAVTSSSVRGVFAAGEVTDSTYKQAITAAAAGAQAAIDAERWLRQQPMIAIQGTEQTDMIPIETREMGTDPIERPRADRSATERNSAEAQPVDCDLTQIDCIQSMVNKFSVVVFSKSYCPYCKRAIETLRMEGVKNEPFLKIVDLTAIENMPAVQDALKQMTGRRTVPNVFVGGTSIGGGDETTTLHRDGKLHALLQNANAFADIANDGNGECDLAQEDCIKLIVNKYPVVVFSKPYCPYCRKALEALNIEGVDDKPFLNVIDLTAIENGRAVQDALQKLTGRRTVPNVFVGGKSIGGGDETTSLHRGGKLRPLLEQAGALGQPI